MTIPKHLVKHPVSIVCGVKDTDSHIEAAEKAIAVMRSAGMSARSIKKAEAMLADAKARGMK